MDIYPIACESLGTRSFAHVVITDDAFILIDPSVSLAPRRYGLPPHPQEIAASWFSRKIILAAAKKADVIIQTHYHADHYSLGIQRNYEFTNQEVFNQIYHPNVTILAKDIKNNINYRQKRRGYWLWKKQDLEIRVADGNNFKFGDTEITFSDAVPHGEDTVRGYVVETLIEEDGEAYLYTSDVVGPGSEEAVAFIVSHAPNILVFDGPSSYHPRISKEVMNQVFDYMKTIADIAERTYVDHHFLRDMEWRKLLKDKIGHALKAFSEFHSVAPMLLEASRKILHENSSVDDGFYDQFFQQPESLADYFNDTVTLLPAYNYWCNLLELFNSY